MKILPPLFILILTFSVFGQNAYINSKYNFTIPAPVGTELSSDSTDGTLAYFGCGAPSCGYMTVYAVKPTPKFTDKEVTIAIQRPQFLKNNANRFISGFKSKRGVKLLSSKFAIYSGRPSTRIEFSELISGKWFSGYMVTMYVQEKQIVVGFNCMAPNKAAALWKSLCDAAIDGFVINKK